MTAPTFFTVTADYLPSTDKGNIWGTLEFTMLIASGDTLAIPSLDTIIVPVVTPASLSKGVLVDATGNPGVELLANAAAVGLSGALYYQVTFNQVWYQAPGEAPVEMPLNTFTFQAPTTATTVDLSTVTPAAGVVAAQVASVVSANITDATTIGRQILTSPSAAAALAALRATPTKLVSIGDNGFGSTLIGDATSTVGTSEMMFTVGVAATGIAPLWTHWYSANSTAYDTDPAGPISFNASLKIVSSSNPGTVTGTLYRLTFNGRTTATLDPGGRITPDILGICVAPGDVVAVRTYLISGTAYAPRVTYGPPNVTGWGGFTAGTDLTAPGSASIASATGVNYGPAVLLGNAAGAPAAKSVLLLGDSIGIGSYDTAYWTQPAIGLGGFAIRALTGVAGLINASIAGDYAAWFQGTNGSFHRLSNAARCNSAIIEYGGNDIFNGSETASQLETYNLNIASSLLRLGISKVFLTTLTPRTTSTDSWATTGNQSTLTGESQRVAYNTWVRAGCPVNPTTLAPVAVGTSNALLAGSFGHPITGIFDTAATVESSLNSGVWLPCNRVATGSITTGTINLTSSTANFNTANQEAGGDLGTAVALFGAGTGGAALITDIGAIGSSTAAYLGALAGTTVTNAQLNIGIKTIDGDHPSPNGHYLMSQAINTALL